MRKSWKRWAALMGGAVLLCSQYEAVPVRAEENPQEAQAQVQAPQAATELEWDAKGRVTFKNPNTDWVGVRIYLYGPDPDDLANKTNGKQFTGPVIKGELIAPFDLYHLIKESGEYKFEVVLTANNLSTGSGLSDSFEYTKPDKQLPAPVANVSREGVITYSLPDTDGETYTIGTDYGFGFQLYADGQCLVNGGMDKNTVDLRLYHDMQPGKVYYVRVCTLSRDIVKCTDSDWSDLIPINPPEESDSGDSEPAVWEPTPEELKLYATCGTEEVIFTTAENNAYGIRVENSIQGFLCWDCFDAARGDYTVGRTYNILPTDSGEIYKMDSKARITLTIPEALQTNNRTFRMISVTEGGKTTVLQDLDSDPKTITFETDTYHAFALIYRDRK